jgi:hypothetical protein
MGTKPLNLIKKKGKKKKGAGQGLARMGQQGLRDATV